MLLPPQLTVCVVTAENLRIPAPSLYVPRNQTPGRGPSTIQPCANFVFRRTEALYARVTDYLTARALFMTFTFNTRQTHNNNTTRDTQGYSVVSRLACACVCRMLLPLLLLQLLINLANDTQHTRLWRFSSSPRKSQHTPSLLGRISWL